MSHKFKVGDTVFMPFSVLRLAPKGAFEITRLMPPADAGPQYRIKSKLEPCERLARESDLKRADE